MSEIEIREERAGDEAAIRRVHLDAFETPAEADLVDRLRLDCRESLSFVALDDGEIVGHVLFTPARLEPEQGKIVEGMGLAPLAVLACRQRRGIGDALSRHGIAAVERAGHPFLIVLGHPDYYPRFGFEPASKFGVRCEYDDVPDGAFMLLPLGASALDGVTGVARYRPEFAGV